LELLLWRDLLFRDGSLEWVHLVGLISGPNQHNDKRVRFELKDIPMVSAGAFPGDVRLSGKIVAQRETIQYFEYWVRDWKEALDDSER